MNQNPQEPLAVFGNLVALGCGGILFLSILCAGGLTYCAPEPKNKCVPNINNCYDCIFGCR